MASDAVKQAELAQLVALLKKHPIRLVVRVEDDVVARIYANYSEVKAAVVYDPHHPAYLKRLQGLEPLSGYEKIGDRDAE